MVRSRQQLEQIAETAFDSMPKNLQPSEFEQVMSIMLNGSSNALRKRGL